METEEIREDEEPKRGMEQGRDNRLRQKTQMNRSLENQYLHSEAKLPAKDSAHAVALDHLVPSQQLSSTALSRSRLCHVLKALALSADVNLSL